MFINKGEYILLPFFNLLSIHSERFMIIYIDAEMASTFPLAATSPARHVILTRFMIKCTLFIYFYNRGNPSI
jgi:hypothetical protein